jgi:hypothetical protein
MAEERTFLNEGNVYVSNTRVVINGATYATANVTSVRTTSTPANNGCAATMIAVGALGTVGAFLAMLVSRGSGDSITCFLIGVTLFVLGYFWYQSLKPTYHVMLASAGGERQGLTSRDPGLVSRTTRAIAEAIIFRG